jgi:2-dehydropantoate 2-reductase
VDRIETVALIGLGAVGASYLARASENIPMGRIRAIASGERARRYRDAGVTVNGKRYFFPIFEPDAETGAADLAIFAVKYNGLKSAIADMKNQIGPRTVILSLLNGITSERLIEDAYPQSNVLLSTVMGIDATRIGDVTVSSMLGTIQFGEASNTDGAYSPSVGRVLEFFESARIPCAIPADMRRTLWKKFMLNVGVNQTSAVLRCPYGALQHESAAREAAKSAMEEVMALSAHENVNLNDEDMSYGLALLDKLSPEGKTSMCQDVEASRPTEVAIFGETVVEMGRAHGLRFPVNELLARLIRAIEEAYIQ